MRDIASLDTSITAQERYRLLVDAVTDYAIYMLDAGGRIASWNSGAKRFKGYDESEILGQHFSRFYTDEDRATGLPQHALKTAATEGRFEGEGWRVRKDGTHFWCHVVIDPIWSPSGELVGFAKVTRDLTERKLAEESLKQSEQQFRLLVQSVTDYAIYMLDPNGLITNWNVGAERIKGYQPDEIIGQHYSLFFTEEDRQDGAPQRGLDTALREGRFASQGWRVRKDGSRFLASVVVDPIRSDTGRLIGFAKVTAISLKVSRRSANWKMLAKRCSNPKKSRHLAGLPAGSHMTSIMCSWQWLAHWNWYASAQLRTRESAPCWTTLFTAPSAASPCPNACSHSLGAKSCIPNLSMCLPWFGAWRICFDSRWARTSVSTRSSR